MRTVSGINLPCSETVVSVLYVELKQVGGWFHGKWCYALSMKRNRRGLEEMQRLISWVVEMQFLGNQILINQQQQTKFDRGVQVPNLFGNVASWLPLKLCCNFSHFKLQLQVCTYVFAIYWRYLRFFCYKVRVVWRVCLFWCFFLPKVQGAK